MRTLIPPPPFPALHQPSHPWQLPRVTRPTLVVLWSVWTPTRATVTGTVRRWTDVRRWGQKNNTFCVTTRPIWSLFLTPSRSVKDRDICCMCLIYTCIFFSVCQSRYILNSTWISEWGVCRKKQTGSLDSGHALIPTKLILKSGRPGGLELKM